MKKILAILILKFKNREQKKQNFGRVLLRPTRLVFSIATLKIPSFKQKQMIEDYLMSLNIRMRRCKNFWDMF